MKNVETSKTKKVKTLLFQRKKSDGVNVVGGCVEKEVSVKNLSAGTSHKVSARLYDPKSDRYGEGTPELVFMTKVCCFNFLI